MDRPSVAEFAVCNRQLLSELEQSGQTEVEASDSCRPAVVAVLGSAEAVGRCRNLQQVVCCSSGAGVCWKSGLKQGGEIFGAEFLRQGTVLHARHSALMFPPPHRGLA
jgi:hypothetical protein